MSKVRNWKQRWDPNAEFVFLKKIKLLDGKDPYVYPGDKLTAKLRKRLSVTRLRIWWDGGYIGLAESAQSPNRHTRPEPATAERSRIRRANADLEVDAAREKAELTQEELDFTVLLLRDEQPKFLAMTHEERAVVMEKAAAKR